MNKLLKQRNVVLALLAIIAIAGIVAYLMIGFGAGTQFNGAKQYSAKIADTEFDPETFDMKTLESDLSTALGKNIDATIAVNYSTGGYELCISVSPGSYALLIDNAVSMLGESYPEFGIESFTERTLSAAQGREAVSAMLIVLVIVWALSFIAAGINLGFKDGMPVFLLSVLNTLVVFAVYVFARLDNFTLLVAALIGTVIVTLFYGAPRITALDRAYRSQGKKDLAAICAEVSSRENAFNTILLAVVVVAAFCASAIFVGVDSILPVGIMIAVVLLTGLAATGLALPGMWAASYKK